MRYKSDSGKGSQSYSGTESNSDSETDSQPDSESGRKRAPTVHNLGGTIMEGTADRAQNVGGTSQTMGKAVSQTRG